LQKNFALFDYLVSEKNVKSALASPHAWSILWRNGW